MPGLENYKPVKQRIHEFRTAHPDWTIRTTVTLTGDHWKSETLISDAAGHLIANGNAYEQAKKAFDMEKAETSSVGRALVFAGWTDSLELSQEEAERAEGVQEQNKQAPPTRTPDKGPVTAETIQRQPPLEPADKTAPPKDLDWLLRMQRPVSSAPKGFWQEHIRELVAADTYEQAGVPWRDLTGGKGFDELKTLELKKLVEDVDKWLHEPEVEA